MNAGASTLARALEGARYRAASPHGHVESYFVKANDPASRRALWLKFTIYAPRRDPRRALAEIWAIAFDERGPAGARHVAVKSTVPLERARFADAAVDIEADGCALSRGGARGRIDTAGRSIAYDLSFDAIEPPLVHFARGWMYDGPFPSSKLVSPIPDMRVSGTVRVSDGAREEVWSIERWPGLLGHNWGKHHAHLYAWGHCNLWDDPRAELVFEGVSARVKVGPVTTPTVTLLCVRHRGVRYELNALSDLRRNTGHVSPRRWTFRGESRLARIEGEMCGETDDFVGLHYLNPDGAMTYCLNTKLARCELDLTVRGRATTRFRSTAAALEIGTRDAHHGVRMYV